MLGAGLSGLAAAHWLSRMDVPLTMLERAPEVGGLARTLQRNGYRYDLSGYRFIGSSSEMRQLFRDLLGPDLLQVSGSSTIFAGGRRYEYPLAPLDLLRGLGKRELAMAAWSYAGSRFARLAPLHRTPRNLEEWLLDEFGDTLYRAFFRDYNEKIWGLPCHRLSAELASMRIRGVDLIRGLVDEVLPEALKRLAPSRRFLYPRFGIGQLSVAFAKEIEKKSSIRLEASATSIKVRRGRVEGVTFQDKHGATQTLEGTNLISSIPLPRLVFLLEPRPPADVLAAAQALAFRDLITVCLEVNRERLVQESWIYVPDPAVGFARILEPKNWSEAMAPTGKTSLVAEYYCTEGDRLWARSDDELVEQTVRDLCERMKICAKGEVTGGFVLRTRKAYPVYELGYHEHLVRIHGYLKTIVNLQAIGRGGLFKYYNVGHLVESGIRAGENVFGAGHDLWGLEGAHRPRPGLFRV